MGALADSRFWILGLGLGVWVRVLDPRRGRLGLGRLARPVTASPSLPLTSGRFGGGRQTRNAASPPDWPHSCCSHSADLASPKTPYGGGGLGRACLGPAARDAGRWRGVAVPFIIPVPSLRSPSSFFCCADFHSALPLLLFLTHLVFSPAARISFCLLGPPSLFLGSFPLFVTIAPFPRPFLYASRPLLSLCP